MALNGIHIAVISTSLLKIPGLKRPLISWDDAAGARFADRPDYLPDSAG